MIRKYLLPFLAIVGLGAAIFMVIQGNRTVSVVQPAVQSAQAPFTSSIFGPGIVEASSENIAIGTPVSGIVTAIYIKWGDRVKAGAPLFKVDTRDLEAQLLPANAKVKEVEAQLLPATAKVNEGEATVAKAENRLKVGEGLEPGVSISVEEMANRRFDVGIDKAMVASAQAQVEQIKSQIASAKAQVEQIERNLELRTIRAPISGRILQMKTRLGEYAQSGVLSVPLMLLGDDTSLHVRVDIDENDAWKFRPCASAVASVRGNPDIKTPLHYVRTDPDVVPKVLLTGDTTQRTDTRVLQVVYSFDPKSLPLFVGQQMDVFIEAAGSNTAPQPKQATGPCKDVKREETLMLNVAMKMLKGDRAKYVGLLFGITFTSFLVTFAGSYFCGFMTRGFALISENPAADVWVMDPAMESAEVTTNLPDSALPRVRSVQGVLSAAPLALATADARFPNGRFQSFQLICVDDATLSGLPSLQGGVSQTMLRTPDAVAVDPGGTDGKLETPTMAADQWPYGQPHLNVPTRELAAGDELLVNDHRVMVRGRTNALHRFPPRPLMYTTLSNAKRILLPERHLLTFVLAKAAPGVSPRELAARIQMQTGLRARSSDDFISDTVYWILINSEDVGDMASMISIAMFVGFGVTGVMLYMFTREALKQYAVLKAMGANSRMLLSMIFAQTGFCALLGTGLGLGLCAIVGQIAIWEFDYPFRMMWFTPVVGGLSVLLVSLVAAAISARPVLKLEPGVVFGGR